MSSRPVGDALDPDLGRKEEKAEKRKEGKEGRKTRRKGGEVGVL